MATCEACGLHAEKCVCEQGNGENLATLRDDSPLNRAWVSRWLNGAEVSA